MLVPFTPPPFLLFPNMNHRGADQLGTYAFFIFSQNNLTDGEEDLPEDAFSLLSVLLVGSLNFPFDRSRVVPRRQPPARVPSLLSFLSLILFLSPFSKAPIRSRSNHTTVVSVIRSLYPFSRHPLLIVLTLFFQSFPSPSDTSYNR